MRLQIHHSTTYEYDNPVILLPHIIRLTPRQDSYQSVPDFSLRIEPEPQFQSQSLDELGNVICTCRWFDDKVQTLKIQAKSCVETHCDNPFHYLLDPWAIRLPMDNPRYQIHSLSPYLKPLSPVNSRILDLAEDIAEESHYQVSNFLWNLNQKIYESCHYLQRLEGPARPPGMTWKMQEGTCRDFALVFIATCQVMGLAARFVSGYERGKPGLKQTLHAWAEVYLPGAGWRGYDPTLGVAVGNRHVAIAAHWSPALTLPISGSHKGQAQSKLTSTVQIEAEE